MLPPRAGLICASTEGGGSFVLPLRAGLICASCIPYSRKYWRSLNLAIWSRAAEIKILADLNLAVVPYI